MDCWRWTSLGVWCGAVVVVLACAGCAGSSAEVEPSVVPETLEPAEAVEAVEAEVMSDVVETVERVPPMGEGFDAGLEVVRWSTGDEGGRVGGVLAGLGERWALSGSRREVWEQAGFRVLRVREDELFGVMSALPPVRSLEREWVGNGVRWRTLAGAGGDRLSLDGESAAMLDGGVRLLSRSWVSPSAEGARVRVDLAVVRSGGERRAFYTETPDERVLDSGTGAAVLGNLRAEFELASGEIILITAEHPGVVWAAAKAQEGVGEGFFTWGGSGGDDDAESGRRGALTVGEAMLLREDETMGAVRGVIVLLGRAPEEFRLLR